MIILTFYPSRLYRIIINVEFEESAPPSWPSCWGLVTACILFSVYDSLSNCVRTDFAGQRLRNITMDPDWDAVTYEDTLRLFAGAGLIAGLLPLLQVTDICPLLLLDVIHVVVDNRLTHMWRSRWRLCLLVLSTSALPC